MVRCKTWQVRKGPSNDERGNGSINITATDEYDPEGRRDVIDGSFKQRDIDGTSEEQDYEYENDNRTRKLYLLVHQEVCAMTISLDERIEAALHGELKGQGIHDFSGASSAIAKAEQVMSLLSREQFSPSGSIFINIGGADGTELEHILLNTDAKYGYLLEYDDSLSETARTKAQALKKHGKIMQVFTGDATQKVDAILKPLESLRADGKVHAIVLTMHAVLHEFPNRGSGTRDLESFLHKFLWHDLLVLAIAREPCMPTELPPTVYISAGCRPDILAKLAKRIRDVHPDLRGSQDVYPMAEKVRMDSRLAVETIVKLFYLDSLAYEINEKVTSFTKQELVDAFRNVFGTDNVRTETLQTDSLDRFWRDLSIRWWDLQLRELPKPELHIRIVAKWIPPGHKMLKQETGKYRSLSHQPSDTRMNAQGTPASDSKQTKSGEMANENAPFDTISNGAILISPPSSLCPPLDLWTPGPTKQKIISYYRPLLGKTISENLWKLSQDAISAVASGDFKRQVSIGHDLENIAADNTYLKAEGSYFAGEGYRLLADVENNKDEVARLHAIAIEKYERSSEILPYDPRPLRGMGRIFEVQGNYEKALSYMKRSKGLCLSGLGSCEASERLDLVHEMLRATRHLIHCLIDIRRTNPLSHWHRENKRQELEGLLVECENYHREFMPIFEHTESWFLIEWFMGLVFLARSWSHVGQPERAKQCLIFALNARRKLISHDEVLNSVEISNLRWWLAVAKDRSTGFDFRSYEMIEHMEAALNIGNRGAIDRVIEDFLMRFLAPWSKGKSI
jgi:tetratricopeptide (TPR) repeat protein